MGPHFDKIQWQQLVVELFLTISLTPVMHFHFSRRANLPIFQMLVGGSVSQWLQTSSSNFVKKTPLLFIHTFGEIIYKLSNKLALPTLVIHLGLGYGLTKNLYKIFK